MLKTPKQRFLESAHSGAWGKIASGETFDEAIHAAISVVQANLPQECPIPQQACDAYQQMIGAQKLAEALSSLHIPETTKPQTKREELNYKAGV